MSGDTCVYEGCSNARDKFIGDDVGPSALPGSVDAEREGEFDFPDPPQPENTELCQGCNTARLNARNEATRAFRWTKQDETLEAWRKRLRELEAAKGKPHGLAALHGYRDKVRRMIRPKTG